LDCWERRTPNRSIGSTGSALPANRVSFDLVEEMIETIGAVAERAGMSLP
jgi:hypothetical protein